MKTVKKNGFLTFMLSLFPGAAHMYMGFMKIGLSLMSLFFITVAVASILNMVMLGFACIIIWVYSFFLANNLASSPDEEFAKVEDKFLFEGNLAIGKKMTEEKWRKYFGIGLIMFGIILIWNISMNMFIPRILHHFPDFPNAVFWQLRNLVPQLVAGIAVIVIGTKIMRGKKKTLPGEEGES
ncbi:MAG: hypothetical protein FWG91_11255 [Lachnospiraceae bacterium]|nr:hypothetical protein [Lachnospiraceae bacterium]